MRRICAGILSPEFPQRDCLAAWAQGRCEAAVSPALLAEYNETTEELRAEHPARSFVPWPETLPVPFEAKSSALNQNNAGICYL